jgi:hypothetical protein
MEDIKRRFELLAPFFDERRRRLFAGAEVIAGATILTVTQATGLAYETVRRGVDELEAPALLGLAVDRARNKGGGRHRAIKNQPGILEALSSLVESATCGDPERPLLWVSKSRRNLSASLKALGFRAGHTLVGTLLEELGFSLQVNRKTREGSRHPERNAQFEYINARIKEFQNEHQPTISVDTKKKELVGDFRATGSELRPNGQPEKVRVHDFIDAELGKVAPYGIYDIAKNDGFVNVGITHDTASFAVASIDRWWQECGTIRYPGAQRLLITADCGGSNGIRVRLWKYELQQLANKTGLSITVAHHPPGTSKWNRIEHRLFAFITKNWRGKPLISHEVIVNLIGATKTKQGLSVACRLDETTYAKGVIVSDEQMANLNIHCAVFQGEWNYTVAPQAKSC